MKPAAKKRKILMISQTVFPPDIRIEKEIRSLYHAGYEVLLICNQYVYNKNPEFKFCTIIRLRAIFKTEKLNRFINFPFFFNPRYIYYAVKSILSFKPDVIHAHDLPMVPIAILLGKISGKPVVFDMHENYPEALKAFQKKGIRDFIFKNYRLAHFLEKICIRLVDRIIVVVSENKERLVKMKIKPEKIFVVSNTVDYENFYVRNTSKVEVNLNFTKSEIVLYTGGLSPDRDLLTAVKSTIYFDQFGISAAILIIGDGVHKKELIKKTEEIKAKEKVYFLDWPGHDIIPYYIEKAKVCIIPQPNNNFINTTIPHKLFEYMFMGKPVLVSDAIPIKRIVEETKAGIWFKSGDEKDFAFKLSILLNDKKNLGANGRNAVLMKYNWNVDSIELLKMYSKLLG